MHHPHLEGLSVQLPLVAGYNYSTEGLKAVTEKPEKPENIKQSEKAVVNGPEAFAARNAGANDLQKVKAARTNASDGSLGKHVAGHQEHDDSIQIVFDDHVVSRKNALDEKAASRPTDGQPLLLKGGVQQTEITEQALLRRVAELPPDKQLQVLAAGVQAFNQELDHQKAQILIGTVAGLGDGLVSLTSAVEGMGKAVCDVAQFSNEVMLNDPACLDKAEQAGQAIGKLLVGGVRIWQVSDNYLQSVGAAGAGGDYCKAFRDIAWLGDRLNQRWQEMSPEDKARLTSKLATENLGILASGLGINKLAKSMDVAGALEELGTTASELGAGARDKTGKFIAGMVDQLAPRPLAATPEGFMVPVDNSAEANVFMMKGDKGLPAGVKPSELLEASARYTEDGQINLEATASEKLLEAAEKRGFNRRFVEEKLRAINTTLTDSFLATGAYDKSRHGTERGYGLLVHEELRKRINLLNDPYLNTEVSYLKGELSGWSKLGISRIDIILGKLEEPFGSVCLKTLSATPSAQQERGWVRNLPPFPDGTIVPRMHLKISVPKALERVNHD